MSTSQIQASFNSGEWSPKLYARVDMAKYRSGAALLENWFVDYRGGVSTRPGTKYILTCKDSTHPVRLITFQASFQVGYVLEFGEHYIRFFFDGIPIIEASHNITAITTGPVTTVTIPGSNYAVGDWIFLDGIAGTTELNGRYFYISVVNGSTYNIVSINNGLDINSTTYGAYTGGGTSSRIYTLPSPYAGTDLALIKFTQNVKDMILCHPNHPPYVLTLITATNWTLTPIIFGTTATAPTNPTASVAIAPLAAGQVASPARVGYSFVVTSIDANNEESAPSVPATITTVNMQTQAATISISWTAVPGAVRYNIYQAVPSYFGSVPPGSIYGFVGTTTGTRFDDTNIAPDFSRTPPIVKNPFVGSGIGSIVVTNPGVYTSVPDVTLTPTGATPTATATAQAILQVQGTPTVGAGGSGYVVGDTVALSNGVILVVATIGAGGAVTAWEPVNFAPSSPGQITGGNTPTNPVSQVSTPGQGTGASANLVWGVGLVNVTYPGAGYDTPPTVTFSSGAATANAVVGAGNTGYPTVPGFFQQRLVLAAPTIAPQTIHFSQPGQYYNFNESFPIQPSDAIDVTIVSGVLNTIKAVIPQTSGLLVFGDRSSWLINGGSPGSAITPANIVANAQSFNGISDVPPFVATFDVLYVQSKGSIVRDSAYNIYANVFTGTDISVVASHLFYGFTITQWAWAEEPFKVCWAVRSDGVMITLTFLKEQEFIGWAHSVTNGEFVSVTTVTENTQGAGEVDAVYTVVQRVINGVTLKYIERVAERSFFSGASDAWTVDAGLQYIGPPVTTLTGAEHLAGQTVTGLANGTVIPPFVMPNDGIFTLQTPATVVTLGVGFTCDLQTLALDLGDPTIQGRTKKIPEVVVRCADTLGLTIGSSFNHLVQMKDLVIGNVSTMLTGQDSQQVVGLVSGDARTIVDSTYTVPGQYCIRQAQPLPATVLGVIPNYVIADRERA